MNKLFSLAFCFLMSIACGDLWAQTRVFECSGVAYEVMHADGNSVAVVRGSRVYSGSVNIPGSVSHEGRSYSVRAIAEGAFRDSYVSNVSLPYNLAEIGAEAFKGCRSLSRINLPNNVGVIGAGCFEDCTALYTVDVGYSSSLRVLPARCFRNCNSLRELRLPPYITAIGDACFQDCRLLRTISIPCRVETIGSNAFRACRSLNSVTLPAALRKLGSCCFGACYNLRAVVCESRNPYPVYESTALRGDGVNIYRQATLRVPRGLLDNYKQVVGWREFGKMEEF